MAILELKDVCYRYKNKYVNVDAVKNFSCCFETGNVYAIVGASGSGKSTLLSLIAGLDLPFSGEVLYEGTPTSKMDLDKFRKQDVSVIYQSFHLFPLLTALENVMYPLELAKEKVSKAKQKAKELIQSVGLPEQVFHRYPNMLSGGERQRIAIARALSTPSKIILADEPTGNLDMENTKNVLQILLDLAHKKDYCVIIVTHDLEIADQADQVIKVRDGKLMNS